MESRLNFNIRPVMAKKLFQDVCIEYQLYTIINEKIMEICGFMQPCGVVNLTKCFKNI